MKTRGKIAAIQPGDHRQGRTPHSDGNQPEEPPYRLQTAEEITAFLRNADPALPYDGVLRCARGRSFLLPPLLYRLPAAVPFDLHDLAPAVLPDRRTAPEVSDPELPGGAGRTVPGAESGRMSAELLVEGFARLEELRRGFLDAVSGAPASWEAASMVLIVKGEELLARLKPSRVRPGGTEPMPADPLSRIAAGLDRQGRLEAILGELFASWLDTRNPTVRRYLDLALPLFLAYDRGSGTLLAREIDILASRPAAECAALEVLRRLYGTELPALRDRVFRTLVLQLVARTKERLVPLPIPVNLRQNLIASIDRLARQGEPGDPHAAAMLREILRVYREGGADIRKAKSLVENLLYRIEEYRDFFAISLHGTVLKRLFALYRPYLARLAGQECLTVPVRQTERVRQTEGSVPMDGFRLRLTLYPCKDYHDLLKGWFSGDCTVSPELAEAHLANPRFFNLRIFRERKWIGNIYCLDYSDRGGTLILDRIQLSPEEELIPVTFFDSLVRTLNTAMAAESDGSTIEILRILAPPSISNYRWIQRLFDLSIAGYPRTAFTVPESERAFESCGCRSFVVLGGGPPGSIVP